jgi:putative transport protein
MSEIAQFLAHNELFLLVFVILVGVSAAKLQVFGVPLGLAGVLFAGLFVATFFKPADSELHIAPQLKEFGLTLFVYCIGLSSGPGFFSAFRTRGVRLNLAVIFSLLLGAAVAVIGGRLLGLHHGLIAGVFCGALTNTPALGAATDVLRGTKEAVGPVLGYSVTYPFGVLGALLCFRVFISLRKKHSANDKNSLIPTRKPAIENAACLVTQAEAIEHSIGEQRVREKIGVIVCRVLRSGQQIVPTKYTVLKKGDILSIVGTHDAVKSAIAYFGEPSHIHPDADRENIDMRRILVSNRELAGLTVNELNLDRRFNAQISRLRRADVDLVPSPEFRIELGDRLRVVASRTQLPKVAKFFGDSERELAEVDFVGLALGLCAGLLLARVPIHLFGTTLTLGVAGGPLLVALLVGRAGRTGSISWTVPFETNRALRELGLLLFLAGVGVSAGAGLDQLAWGSAARLLILGILVTLTTTTMVLFLAKRWAKEGTVASMGVSSGMQTQPAILASAFELSGKSEETYVAYAVVYPVAMIGKILIAQMIALMA